MAKKKKVHVPTQEDAMIPYTFNVEDQVVNGGIAAKYGDVWPVGEIAKATAYKTDVPTAINVAFQAVQTAQEKTQIKNDLLNEVTLFNKRKGREMQDSPGFDAADLELIGYFQISTPPDPNTAKPRFTGFTVLPDMIILEWFRGVWSGVVVYGSTDGVTYTRLDKDNRSPFEDKRLNQAAQPEVRWYKLRYLKGDDLIGVDSDPLKVVADIH